MATERMVTIGIFLSRVVDTLPSLEVVTTKYTALSVWHQLDVLFDIAKLTTIKKRGDNLLDLPNLETSNSALEEKSTRSAATYQLYVNHRS